MLLVRLATGYQVAILAPSLILSASLVIAAVALAYLANPIVPIFLIAVLGAPVTAFLLNRYPRDQEN